MRRLIVGMAAVVMGVSAARAAEEQALQTRVESVELFKNGLAVVRRTADVPAGGIYRIDDVPNPVHGTFWVESTAHVAVRTTMRQVEAPPRARAAIDLQEALVGQRVRIAFREPGLEPVSATVVALARPRGDEAWNRTYEQPRYYGWDAGGRSQAAGRFLVLQTDQGRIFVDESMIAMVVVEGAGEAITQRRPVLLLDVDEDMKQPVAITISYLTRGIAWAPDYRIDLLNSRRLSITQHAVIRNELADLDDTELRLISGFPSIQFAHVVSPLSQKTNWSQFFQQLMAPPSTGHPAAFNVMGQRVISNRAEADPALDAIPEGEGVDLHYQSIGRHTLAEGDALALTVASAEADYERIVEWVVPDIRRADGRQIDEHHRNQDPEKYEDAAWDAVIFKNPLPFPMTTGAATVTSNGRFNGQQMATWTNVGEETTIKVTKALSIRTKATEQEEQGEASRAIVYIGGDDYRKVEAKGQLQVSNHRKEPVKLVIRRQFSGELKRADGDPKLTLREEGIWSVNRRNQLTWTITLQPGEERTLSYAYSVLVNH